MKRTNIFGVAACMAGLGFLGACASTGSGANAGELGKTDLSQQKAGACSEGAGACSEGSGACSDGAKSCGEKSEADGNLGLVGDKASATGGCSAHAAPKN